MTSDAYIAILDSTGKLDTAFGTGLLKFELGANDAEALGGEAIGLRLCRGERVLPALFELVRGVCR